MICRITKMKKFLVLALAAAAVQSCSLLKFSVDMGDEPMPAADVNTRVMVRAFYKDFSAGIINAADSIVTVSSDLNTKMRAMRWKMDATSICAGTAYGSLPEMSLLNTWLFCNTMDLYMASAPDSLLFGPQSGIAREVSGRMNGKIDSLAAKILPGQRYRLMKNFVTEHSSLSDPAVQKDMLLKWISFTGQSDTSYVKSQGSISQTIADMSDKMSGYSSQWANEISWTKDMFTARFESDTTGDELKNRLDSLYADFHRMSLVLENSPEIMASITDDMNAQLTELINTINYSLDHAFSNIDTQRAALETFLDTQRVRLMKEADASVAAAIDRTMDGVPALIGSILLYLVLFIAVLFSIPFALGFMLGRLREKRAAKKKDGPDGRD